MRNSLRLRLTIVFIGLATIPLLFVSVVLAQRNFSVISEQAIDLQSEVAQRVAKDVVDLVGNRESELLFLTNIRNIMLLDEEEQLNTLTGLLASQNMYQEVALLNGDGQELIRVAPLKTFAEEELQNRTGSPEFEEAKASGVVYYSAVQFDEITGEPFIVISAPSFDLRSGELLGVLVANFRFKPIWDVMSGAQVPGNGIVYLVDADNRIVAHRDPSIVLQGTEYVIPEDGFQLGLSGEEAAIVSTANLFGAQEFFTVAELARNEALSLAITTSYLIGVAFLIALVVAIVVSVLVARQIVSPIETLAITSEEIAAGDFSLRVDIDRKDEIGVLATAFNNMTSQLRNLIASLELRVAERTKALATSTDVSRQLSTILSMDVLVPEVVNQIRDAFGYYHAQIYLYDDEREYLLMAGGTGNAGQKMLDAGHKLERGRGLVGRAAITNEVILIPDVLQDENWLANELLLDTKAEAAIPIALGDEVFGVLDVQHNVTDGLNEESIDLLQSIANQVAIAIQNARQYEQTQMALAESERLYSLSEKQAQRLAALNEMSAAFNTAVSDEDIYAIVGENLLRMITGDRASIALLDANDEEKAEVILLGGEAFAPIDKTQILLSKTAIGLAIRENRTIRLPFDAPMTDFADGRMFMERGFPSLMVVPLQYGGRVLGTLNIGNKQEQVFRDSGLDFIQQVASTIATNIESQRVGAQARLLASLVENHPDFMGIGSLTGEAVYINPSGLKLLNLPLDTDVTELDTRTLYSAEDGTMLLNVGIPSAIETGSWAAEVDLNRMDGTKIPVEETIGINYDANKQPVSFSMTMRDITDRKEAAQAIQDSQATAVAFQGKLTILYQMTVELSREENLDKVFEKAIRDARIKLGIDRLGLWLFNEDVSMMYGTYGIDGQGEVEDTRHRRAAIGEDTEGSWVLPFLEDNERYLVNEDADLYDDDVIKGRGWQIVVVLWHDDRPLGLLAVDNLVQQQPLQSYEPDLIALYANALSGIIVNKRAEAVQVKQARELQTVAEVSRVATTILDTKELLQQTADLTKERFELYHAHIYLMSANGEQLILTAGAGDMGRIMVDEGRQIPLAQEQSLVAQAARMRNGVVVNNVRLEEGFLPNPLLPETRAELATPIMIGDKVLGVIDVQSNQVDYFTQSDVDTQLTLAAQIAVAMQNAAQYQRTQAALEDVTRMQQLLVQDGWKSFLDDDAQSIQGYQFTQDNLQSIKENDGKELVKLDHTAVTLPLTVRGANIGTLGVRNASGQPVSAEKQELLRSMSIQVAEALERARLFQQAEVARSRTESALQETQRRTEELAIINQIVTDLGASLDVSDSMKIVVDGIAESLGVEQCRIALIDKDGKSLTIVAEHFNPEKSTSALGLTIPIEGNSLTQEVLETRRTIVVEEIATDPLVESIRNLLEGQGIKSLAVLPMIVGNQTLGTVGIDLLEEGQRFTEDQLELARTIIFQAATAVQNARLYTQTQRRAERERMVNTINQKIQGTTTVEGALQTAIEELGLALHARKTRVALHLDKNEKQNGRNEPN